MSRRDSSIESYNPDSAKAIQMTRMNANVYGNGKATVSRWIRPAILPTFIPSPIR
jgi:hypothetical protein